MFAPCKFYDINKGMHIRDFGFNPATEEWFDTQYYVVMDAGRNRGFFDVFERGRFSNNENFSGQVQDVLNFGEKLVMKRYLGSKCYDYMNCSFYTHIELYKNLGEYYTDKKIDTKRVLLIPTRARFFV